jgi:hypothetical protein
MKPIFIVPPEPLELPDEPGDVVLFNALEQPATPASPPPRATPAAPRKPRLLSWLRWPIGEFVNGSLRV